MYGKDNCERGFNLAYDVVRPRGKALGFSSRAIPHLHACNFHRLGTYDTIQKAAANKPDDAYIVVGGSLRNN